jgi:cytoskeletal protein RodZ
MRGGLPETGAIDSEKRTVGSYLREVRESRGLTLEEAARITRIGKNYLLAIEGEMFDKLPNPAYIKGFLRVYAGYLGLSGDEIIAMYDRSLAPLPPQFSPDSTKNEPLQKERAAGARPGRWLVPVILLIAVVTVAYIVGGKDEKGHKSPAPVPLTATLPGPVQPPRSTVRQQPGPRITVAAPPKSGMVESGGEQPSGIILKLKVNQDCWLNITIDSTVSQQYDLKAGDLIEWKGEKVFVLDLGNAGGIEAEFNGKSLKPFGESGKTAHVVLKVDGA